MTLPLPTTGDTHSGLPTETQKVLDVPNFAFFTISATYSSEKAQKLQFLFNFFLGKCLFRNLFFFFMYRNNFFFVINLFIYLVLALLGLRFCARAFSSCGKRGPLFIAVRGPLTVAASLVAEHRLQTRRLSCGSRA